MGKYQINSGKIGEETQKITKKLREILNKKLLDNFNNNKKLAGKFQKK